jgi:hypothetical protein
MSKRLITILGMLVATSIALSGCSPEQVKTEPAEDEAKYLTCVEPEGTEIPIKIIGQRVWFFENEAEDPTFMETSVVWHDSDVFPGVDVRYQLSRVSGTLLVSFMGKELTIDKYDCQVSNGVKF